MRETAAEWFRRLFDANVIAIGYGRGDMLLEANEALLSVMAAGGARDVAISMAEVFTTSDATGMILGGPMREVAATRIDGSEAHLLASTIAGADDDWMLVAIDVSERNAAERAIAHLAMHDPTTGVPNRRLLMDRLEQALARGIREEATTAVLFCDIDHFKHVNDAFGHRVGDAVLQAAAFRFNSVLRPYDTVARVGGDEFIILLEQLPDPNDAMRLAQRARHAINAPMEIDSVVVHITVSIGVALAARGEPDADVLLRHADDAMYTAKERGRDQVAISE